MFPIDSSYGGECALIYRVAVCIHMYQLISNNVRVVNYVLIMCEIHSDLLYEEAGMKIGKYNLHRSVYLL